MLDVSDFSIIGASDLGVAAADDFTVDVPYVAPTTSSNAPGGRAGGGRGRDKHDCKGDCGKGGILDRIPKPVKIGGALALGYGLYRFARGR